MAWRCSAHSNSKSFKKMYAVSILEQSCLLEFLITHFLFPGTKMRVIRGLGVVLSKLEILPELQFQFLWVSKGQGITRLSIAYCCHLRFYKGMDKKPPYLHSTEHCSQVQGSYTL